MLGYVLRPASAETVLIRSRRSGCHAHLPAAPACLHCLPARHSASTRPAVSHPLACTLLQDIVLPVRLLQISRLVCCQRGSNRAWRAGQLHNLALPAAARSCAATSPLAPLLTSPPPCLPRQSVGYPAALIAKGPGVPFLAGGPFMSAGPQVRCQVACKNWPRIHVRLEACMLRWLLRPNAWHRWAQCCRPQACRPDQHLTVSSSLHS